MIANGNYVYYGDEIVIRKGNRYLVEKLESGDYKITSLDDLDNFTIGYLDYNRFTEQDIKTFFE